MGKTGFLWRLEMSVKRYEFAREARSHKVVKSIVKQYILNLLVSEGTSAIYLYTSEDQKSFYV